MRRIFNWKFLLFLIILIGFILRIYQLGQVPDGLYADEAATGYNAYSILLTGRDEYGKFLPVVLKSFGDYKSALQAYLIIPFIKISGLTSLATRLPSAVFSILTIIVFYFFTKKLMGNVRIALISTLLFAISPWGVALGRVAADYNIALFFIMLMAYSLLWLSDKFSKKWLMLTGISAILAIVAYTISRFYVVILLFVYLISSLKRKDKYLVVNKAILILIGVIIFFGIVYTFVGSASRLSQVSIFSTPQTRLVLQEQTREDQFTPILVTRFFHNKLINYTRSFLENYGEYFSFEFLFLDGGFPIREKIPNSGLFYLWQLPFLLYGIYSVLRWKDKRTLLLFLWWLLMLIPAAITFDEIPNVHRSLLVLPIMLIMTAVGIDNAISFKWFKKNVKLKRLILLLILALAIYELLYFGHQYLVHQDAHQPWVRGAAAYDELIPAIEKYYPNYKKIVISKSVGSPYIYILFLSKYDPRKYQLEGSSRDLDYTGFDKYFFIPMDCPIEGIKDKNLIEGALFINSGNCNTLQYKEYEGKLLETVNWSFGIPAFKLVEYSLINSDK